MENAVKCCKTHVVKIMSEKFQKLNKYTCMYGILDAPILKFFLETLTMRIRASPFVSGLNYHNLRIRGL